jgi:hypothetical protein
LVSLVLVAVLLPGCVPVTEPLSDPDKAEPDKRLEGKWEGGAIIEIDRPAVKGNPKGLMRARDLIDGDRWFFTTKIGKDTYMTIYPNHFNLQEFADFSKEGAFKDWNKVEGDDRRYLICQYVLDGNKLTVDCGSEEAVKKLMEAEKIDEVSNGATKAFKTPKDWLAEYLKKSGPKTIYDGTNVRVYWRPKATKLDTKVKPAGLPTVIGKLADPGIDMRQVVIIIRPIGGLEYPRADEMIVRRRHPPVMFDAKGKPRKPTAKELKELKGEGNLPGYMAEASDLKANQTVTLYLQKPTVKKDDPDSLTDNKPSVRMIIIEAEAQSADGRLP